MKIASIDVNNWAVGRIMIMLDNSDCVHITLTEEETDRFRQLAADVFTSRQKAIAREIETAGPLLIELQSEPITPPDPVDDIPF